MRCKKAHAAILERELGSLGAADRARLETHLADCAACRRRARSEALVTDGLARLAAETPPVVDVRRSVLARIAHLDVPGRSALPAGPLAWAFAGGLLTLVLLAAVAATLLPEAAPVWRGIRVLGGGLVEAGLGLVRFGWAAFEPAGPPALGAVRSLLSPLADPDLVLAVHAVVVAGAVMSLSLSFWVVCREFVRSAPRPPPTEEA